MAGEVGTRLLDREIILLDSSNGRTRRIWRANQPTAVREGGVPYPHGGKAPEAGFEAGIIPASCLSDGQEVPWVLYLQMPVHRRWQANLQGLPLVQRDWHALFRASTRSNNHIRRVP